MKKTVKLILLAIVSAAVLIATLTGCSGSFGGSGVDPEKDTPINLTVILGVTQNSPDPELSLLNAYMDRLATHGGHLCVIVDDGNCKNNFKELDLKSPDASKSENYQKKEIQANARKAAQLIQSMKAVTPETNTLAALKLAADNTPSANGRKNILVIMDNGIQTMTGNLSAFPMKDLRVLDIKIEDVLDSLQKSKSIPDMSKFDVIEWYGIGQTVSAGEDGQEALLNTDIEALKAYYTEILKRGGVADAKSVFVDHTYKPSVSDHSAYPHVSTVKVTKIEPVPPPEPDEEPSETEKIIGGDGGVLHIDNEKIRFKPDSTELADPEAAKEVLAGVIDRMKNLKGNIVIIGTTATLGAPDSAIEFSKKRAMAIKELIVSENNIDDERIFVYGAGYSDQDLVKDDLDSDGRLDERIAPYNRAVNLVDADSELGTKYINNGTTARKE